MREYISPILISSIAAIGIGIFSLPAQARMTSIPAHQALDTSGSTLMKVNGYADDHIHNPHESKARSQYRAYHHSLPRVIVPRNPFDGPRESRRLVKVPMYADEHRTPEVRPPAPLYVSPPVFPSPHNSHPGTPYPVYK